MEGVHLLATLWLEGMYCYLIYCIDLEAAHQVMALLLTESLRTRLMSVLPCNLG